jgi:hypothetical protein
MDHNDATDVCQYKRCVFSTLVLQYSTRQSDNAEEGVVMERRLIVYNRATKDFAIYVGSELVGYARSYLDAEAVLDQFRMERLRSGNDLRVA